MASSISNVNRLSGLATGLDTESMITQLMNAEKSKYNKLTQKKQLLEWRRDNYRDITNSLRSFYDEFFNKLKPSTNMTSASVYKKFTTSSTDSEVVTATANGDAAAGTHTIKVKQLATAANTGSTTAVSSLVSSDAAGLDYTGGNVNFKVTLNGETKSIAIQNIVYADTAALASEIQSKINTQFGSGEISVSGDNGTGKLTISTVSSSDRMALTSGTANDALDSMKITNGASNTAAVTKNIIGASSASLSYTDTNKYFGLVVDGTTKTIELSTTAYSDVTALAKDIQQKIDSAFGVDKVAVSGDTTTGKLTFSSVTGYQKISLYSASSNSGLSDMGITSGSSNRLNTADTLANLAGKFNVPLTFSGDYLTFTINGKYFSIKSDTTLSSMMNTINSSSAGVEMKYNELTDKFSLTSKQKGSGDNIIISNSSGNLFDASAANSAAGIASGSYNNGVDSIFDLDGLTDLKRSDNVFTVEGVTYTLLDTDASASKTITINQDINSTYNTIKSFVDKYNEILAKINTEISEEYDSDYSPLTAAQREEMSDDDIKTWETKAKTGLLRNDSLLKKIASDLRKAVYDGITGVSGAISDIGITTSSNYLDKGKLIIDENKLKEAIQTNPSKVQDLFAKTSSTDYSANLTSGQRSIRYNGEGFANRFYDIIQDNIRTSRDSSGKKGFLVEKAGITGDLSDVYNTLNTDISRIELDMEDEADRLDDKQTAYYKKFAALETAINKMNSQSSWLSSQFSSN